MSTRTDRIRIALRNCLQMLALNDAQQDLLNLIPDDDSDGERSPLRAQVREALNEFDSLTAEYAGPNPAQAKLDLIAREIKNWRAGGDQPPMGWIENVINGDRRAAVALGGRQAQEAALDRMARDAEEKGLHWNPDLENHEIADRLTHRLVTIVATLDCSHPIIGHGMLKEITGIAREILIRRKP